MKTLVLVTHNSGKLAEANDIAKKYGIRLEMPKNGTEKLEIQADSLEEVSQFSALNAYGKIRKPLVVDDSGLFVNSLNGFPGVYSAYVVPTIGNKGLLKLMRGINDRKAYFECCVSFYDGSNLISFAEKVHGTIIQEEKGKHGFGFDPIFSPDGYDGKSFGEIGLAEKNTLSHRAKAFDSFFKWYSNEQEKR
ncbi:MAG: XTP/dITP diphosphatase [Candidatus Micrarchaeaceae archaeon]|jgi:XTP/dITP diphosphohydrolase